MKGYRYFNIVYNAYNVVLPAENENTLQRLVYIFNNVYQTYNTKITEEKTKSITISHDPLTCKLVIYDRIINQVMQFLRILRNKAHN